MYTGPDGKAPDCKSEVPKGSVFDSRRVLQILMSYSSDGKSAELITLRSSVRVTLGQPVMGR